MPRLFGDGALRFLCNPGVSQNGYRVFDCSPTTCSAPFGGIASHLSKERRVDISINPGCGDDERRLRVYQGELTILPPSPSSLALVKHARDQIEAAFTTPARQ